MRREWIAPWVVVVAVLTGASAMARMWTDRSGHRIDAEFVSVADGQVALQGTNGAVHRIALDQLSDEDRQFAVSQTNGPHQATGAARILKAADPKPFMAIMNRSCVRCHKVTASLDDLEAKQWVRPGDPEHSPIYTKIGKHHKPGGMYHNLSAADKQTIHDFIQACPTNRPAAQGQ